MVPSAAVPRIDPANRRLILALCLGQIGLIALPLLKFDTVVSLIAVLVVYSVVALLGSVSLALLYLCLVSAAVPTRFFDDHLLLPLDFKFYEGLLVVIFALAAASWMQQRRFGWPHRSELDRPVVVFLALVVASMGIGLAYGQDVMQMLRDVRFPLYYALFFVVTGFFSLRRGVTFLSVVVLSATVVGVEYLIEFLQAINLSIAGGFFRVARTEGILLPMGVLVATAALLFDSSPVRRVVCALAMVPIGLALVLTMGRGMWVCLITGIVCLAGLVTLDPRVRGRRAKRLVLLVAIPLVIFGMGTLFEKITHTGVGAMAVRRLQGAVQLEGGSGESLVGRLIAYGVAVERIRERPVFGGGHGATVTYLRTDETDSYTYMFTSGKVDNLYLTLMMRMGIVGLVAFLWVFTRGLKLAYRLFQRTESVQRRFISASFLAVYTAMLVYAMVDSTMIGNRFIFFHAIFLGLLAREIGEDG